MQESGIIEPFMNEWSSPTALEKDGTLRMCVDYQRLNSVSQADAYPMPRIDNLIDRLGKAKYITTIDLMRGYWQVPVAEASRSKTAFMTPLGLFQFRVMPFGLHGAPATFQRMMDRLMDLEIFKEHISTILLFIVLLGRSTLDIYEWLWLWLWSDYVEQDLQRNHLSANLVCHVVFI